MEREEDDSWRRDLIVQHIRTQSLASVISTKSIQTFGGEIASMELWVVIDQEYKHTHTHTSGESCRGEKWVN
jgi:hypothetical protein